MLRSAASVGVATMTSRVLGYLRDTVIATSFGAGAAADAFFVAFRIPNFLRRLFAEGAFSQAFVPVLSEYRARRQPADVRDLVSHTLGTLGAVLLLVTALAVAAAPLLVWLLAPGFGNDAQRAELTTSLLRITFWYLPLVSLAAAVGGVLNTFGRYFAPALTPLFLNLAMIATAVWLAPHLQVPVLALAIGVVIGGLAQLLWQLPTLAATGNLVRPRLGFSHPGVRRILKLMGPGVFGSSVAQVNLMFDTVVASFLATGSVSWLYYADRLMEFPLGVLAIAFATVILPRLSSQHAGGDGAAFSRTLDWGLRWVLLVGAPAAAALGVLAGPLLGTLFSYGAFDARSVLMARQALWAFAPGLLAFMAIKVLAPGYYARQDTRSPVRIGVLAMLANMGITLILVWPLEHAGLAASTSLAAYLNALLLLRGLMRCGAYRPQPGWMAFLLRVTAATAVMSLLLWLGTGSLDAWLALGASGRLLHLALWVVAGAASYGAALLLLRLPLAALRHP
ncbi:murein biosynthesis integral membrane protein MurJ [Immundisolibacter sp.]|uniref:murein biosynthesis integral membrane protein MurJ n=1 Tax=Immundisolibacter sp. TaxID=1934948 RepID=UPI002630DD26|nr:murein biosynthesis integral membrane protein MurJ [Immundisolibacter sp.]MDD3650690.1 murein biosynthesis integral membrane protein MurJ [Immundisolibacter sp.]